MNSSRFNRTPPAIDGARLLPPILAVMVACTAFVACGDDGDGNPPGASGTSAGGATSGRGGSTGAIAGGAGAATVPEGGYAGAGGGAGEPAFGGMAGDTNAGGGAGDSGAAGQGGADGDCAQGYADFGAGCVAACAPHDLDGASIALSIGHTDVITAAYDAASNDLRLFLSDDGFPIPQAASVRRTPESVLVHGRAGAILNVPDLPTLTGIFVAGSDIWLLPEGQPEAEAAGVVWPGFQSYGVDQGLLQNDQVILRLASVAGAGKFVGFESPQDDVTPPKLLFDPTNGLDEYLLDAGTHRHLNWAFTQGGLHRLIFELEAKTVGGKVVKSEPHTYRFFFGELSDLPTAEPTIVAAEGLESSYEDGAPLTLTAARYGAPSTLPTTWSRQCYDPATVEPLPWEPAGVGDTLTTTAENGCQYVACLIDKRKAVAISQAVSPQLQ
jgi:surface-anchored protein